MTLKLCLSFDRVLNKETFLWRYHAENVQQKLVSDHFLLLVNNLKQPLHARNSLKIRYFESGLSKSIKTLTLLFLSKSVPFNVQNYEKQKCLELMTSSEKFLY